MLQNQRCLGFYTEPYIHCYVVYKGNDLIHCTFILKPMLLLISIGTILSASAVGANSQNVAVTNSSSSMLLFGTATAIFSISGGILGIVSFVWRIIEVRRQYLHINLDLSVIDRFVLASTAVENKGSLTKKIENAIILIGPENECPLQTAKSLLPDQNIEQTNDFEFVKLKNAKYDDTGRAFIPVTFYYNENVDIADERIGYDVPINIEKVSKGIPYSVRFFIFGENKLHRSTEKTFIVSNVT